MENCISGFWYGIDTVMYTVIIQLEILFWQHFPECILK